MIDVTPDGEASVLDNEDTMFGPQITAQAWSAGAQSAEVAPYREHHSWATVLRQAGEALDVGTAIAGLVLALDGPDSAASTPTTKASALPVVNTVLPPDPTGPFVMPTVEAAHKADPDTLYLAVLDREIPNGTYVVTEPASVITFGHQQCAFMATVPDGTKVFPGGRTIAWNGNVTNLVTNYTVRGRPPTPELAMALTDASVRAYCPELG